MRYLILAAALMLSAPMAFAQSNTGYPGSPAAGGPMAGQSPRAENCGTPDEPKACPPMPRHPLETYPGHCSSASAGWCRDRG